MSTLIVHNEATLPLTKKRIFKVKLKGAPLCVTYEEVMEKMSLLKETEIFVDSDIHWDELVTKYRTYILFTKDNGEPVLVELQVGQKFTLTNDGGIWRTMGE